jgi:hypothetical protein
MVLVGCSESPENRQVREQRIYEKILENKKPYEEQTEEERKIIQDQFHGRGSFKREFKKPTLPGADNSI